MTDSTSQPNGQPIGQPATNGDEQAAFVERWRENGYNCYSSGHKFCREVCPVTQVTRNENHTPTAFMANIVAMEKGVLDIEDVAERIRQELGVERRTAAHGGEGTETLGEVARALHGRVADALDPLAEDVAREVDLLAARVGGDEQVAVADPVGGHRSQHVEAADTVDGDAARVREHQPGDDPDPQAGERAGAGADDHVGDVRRGDGSGVEAALDERSQVLGVGPRVDHGGRDRVRCAVQAHGDGRGGRVDGQQEHQATPARLDRSTPVVLPVIRTVRPGTARAISGSTSSRKYLAASKLAE